MSINYSFKKARKECREKAIQSNCSYWPLAWNENCGFYCVNECTNNLDIICQVHKSGCFVYTEKEEYITKFRLTNHQHQIGQKIPDFIKSHHKPVTALEMLENYKTNN